MIEKIENKDIIGLQTCKLFSLVIYGYDNTA